MRLEDLTLNDAILNLMQRDYRLSIEYSKLWCLMMIKLSKGEWHAMKGVPMEEFEFIGERLLLDTINKLVKDLEEVRKESKRREQEDIGKLECSIGG